MGLHQPSESQRHQHQPGEPDHAHDALDKSHPRLQRRAISREKREDDEHRQNGETGCARVRGERRPVRILGKPPRDDDDAQARERKRRGGRDNVRWCPRRDAIDHAPREQAGADDGEAADKLKSRAEDAPRRWPHAAMLRDSEQREEGPGDQEVRHLNPAVRKRSKRADWHRDVAVLRLQQSLHDEECCKQEREHDGREGEPPSQRHAARIAKDTSIIAPHLEESLMSRSNEEEKDQIQLGRRKFLRIGTLGAAALAAGATGQAKVAPESEMPGQAGQSPPVQAPPAQGQPAQAPAAPQAASRFKRNFDPVPASEPSMNFAAFTDTHVGQQVRSPNWDYAQHLDRLADDIMDATLPCEFAVHLGDGAFNATAFVNGVGLPDNLKSNYKNNLKDFLISHLNLPFHYVGGNIDLTDYSHNPGLPGHDNDPFVLMRTYINETELNNYPYAMMRNGILFLAVPEMDAEPWTRPATCEWLEFMTTHYHDATTIILSHQAIEDTTPADGAADSYRGQQDQGWWASLFQRNPQIKMFLHGHNHMAGWYQGNQSSGYSRPVQNFGHEMVFASPFPGMSWIVDYNLVDATVIFTISSRFITTKAWKQDGTRGKWCAGFDNTWCVATSFDPNAQDWYSVPFLIQDGETQQTDMKVLSANVTLQLVGTGPVELFYDPKMETKGIHTNENILGFDNDLTSKVTANTPGMTVKGPHTITFPPTHEWDRYCHDGHGGPPYRMFAVGTTPAAAPGGSYTVTMKARSRSGNGRVKLTMSCSDWGTRSQYSTLAGSSHEVLSRVFGK